MKNEDHFIVKRLLADEITRIAYHKKTLRSNEGQNQSFKSII